MKVAFYWGLPGLSMTENNPYGGLLAGEMAKLGVELVPGYRAELTEQWVEENRGRIDLLHIHHPWYHYMAEDFQATATRCSDFIGALAKAQHLGYRLVWTVHNLYPHDSIHLHLDRVVRLDLARRADSLIVHCDYARQCVAEHFYRTENVYTIPHGHFIDAYPNTLSRDQARSQLGLTSDQFVYLFFSNVRRYKGVERLLEVFGSLPGEHLGLLLAAKVKSDYSQDVVTMARESDPRVVVKTAEFFPVDDFQVFMNAADVVVFPFLEVLTSGSVITAMSFRKPVIVPALGCLPELVDDRMGARYDPADRGGLRKAMMAVQGYDLDSCGQAAYDAAKQLTWDGIAEKTLQAYRA
jgi:glycosyltransferase involved in cell wall biosynthesis